MGSGISGISSPQDMDEKLTSVFPPTPAFEGASKEILASLTTGNITYAKAIESLGKFEKACSIVESHFHGAKSSKILLECTKHALLPRGVNSENTLFAQSVCPDEINHEEGNITTIFSSFMGEVFHLGGLAGIPFTGKTGFKAFSHHVPDGGNLFILFAPHIGISDTFTLGKYSRSGQAHDGAACGAAVGAYGCCKSRKTIPDAMYLGSNPFDYQMEYIISELSKRSAIIDSKESENEKQAALATQMYHMSKEFLEHIVDTDFGNGHGKKGSLILLGGIQINMPKPMSDFFQPLIFEIRTKGEPVIDLMHVFNN